MTHIDMTQPDEFTHIVCASCIAKNRVPSQRLNETAVCGKCKKPLIHTQPAVLDDAALAKYIRGNDQLVVVDFWASWCQPCIMMAPQFRHAAQQMPGVRFGKLQTDKYEQAGVQYRIRSLPTMVAFRGGVEVARQSGALSAGQIMQWINSL